jgi:hypothetical protein
VRARVTVTIHGIDALDGVQIAHLTEKITDVFGLVPAIIENDMVSAFLTDDHKRVFQVVEALNAELARKFSPDLWTSIGSDEIPQA